MAKACFQNACIRAMAVSLGQELKRAEEDAELFGASPAQFERIRQSIGLDKRYVARPGVTAADLCEHAARQILAPGASSAENVDGLICVTQTPDHFQPCNAAILHGRLELGQNCTAFDINLGCSGWVVGLYVASLMLEAGGCSRVLLLAGDTMSRCVNPRDRAVGPLFGDAGSATLLERRPSKSWYGLHTDGSGSEYIKIPAGGFRWPCSPDTQIEQEDKDGNLRSPQDLHMNGGEVFNFSIMKEPPAIREVLDFAGIDASSVDYFVFHQANKYIINNIARRLRLPLDKVPSETVSRFGNQSSASIPATVCADLREAVLAKPTRMVFSGFGVGLSWATALIDLPPLDAACISIAP